MVNGRTPWFLVLLMAALLIGVLLTLQPYSADWPGTAYAEPARRYLRAAIARDSLALLAASASTAPVAWALHVARAHPDTLALWARRVQAWTGERRGDTTEVFVYPPSRTCADAPIAIWFVDAGGPPRVLRASSACLEVR